MAEARLDQIVKGAPAPDKQIASVPSSGVITSPNNAPLHPSDPIASLPSSPPQIYLNLLILEASLRAQYLELRARRRQYTFFLTLLAIWILYFTYALFLAPREDGSGIGGSVYWVIEVTEKVCFMGGVITAILVWGTGQWERGIRWPRRWVGVTNRGLRGFNCKIVVVRGTWWREWLSTLQFFFSYGLFFGSGTSSYRWVDHTILSEVEREGFTRGEKTGLLNTHEDESPHRTSRHARGSGPGHEEDLAPGGDTIALLLLPKPFSPSFRENWDLYRTEYWERENARRHAILQRILIREKRLRQQQTWWNRWRHPAQFGALRGDVEKSSGPHANIHRQATTAALTTEKRLRSGSLRSGSHSRGSSRSTTPTPEADPAPPSSRRGSNASIDRRKKRPSSVSAGGGGGTARVHKLTPSNSNVSTRTNTPTMPEAPVSSQLKRENSYNSVGSSSGESTGPGVGAGLGISGTAGGSTDRESARSGRGGGRGVAGRRGASNE